MSDRLLAFLRVSCEWSDDFSASWNKTCDLLNESNEAAHFCLRIRILKISDRLHSLRINSDAASSDHMTQKFDLRVAQFDLFRAQLEAAFPEVQMNRRRK